jgi:hypothetical protein
MVVDFSRMLGEWLKLGYMEADSEALLLPACYLEGYFAFSTITI